MYAYYNPHPSGRRVGDCAVRALAKALGQTWDQTYVCLCLDGFRLGDLPNADIVWSNYLIERGFCRHLIPDDGLGRYTVADFAADHPEGTFVLSMPGRHVLTVVDSVIYDSWDSQNEVPSYYFSRKE